MYNSITNVHTVCELRCDSSASTFKYLKYIYVYVTLNNILIIWNFAKELNFMAWHAEKSFFKPKITPSSTWESSRFEMNNYAVRWNQVHFETQFWEMLQCVHWPRRVWMIFPIWLLLYCNDNNIFRGKLGILGGRFYTSNTLGRTLVLNRTTSWRFSQILLWMG